MERMEFWLWMVKNHLKTLILNPSVTHFQNLRTKFQEAFKNCLLSRKLSYQLVQRMPMYPALSHPNAAEDEETSEEKYGSNRFAQKRDGDDGCRKGIDIGENADFLSVNTLDTPFEKEIRKSR